MIVYTCNTINIPDIFLGVHSFVSLTVRLSNNCIGTMHNAIEVITKHFHCTIYYMATTVCVF